MEGFKRHDSKWWRLSPLAGCLAFSLLYVIATVLYPGGSQADAHARGFSWMHNYWCNLLYEKALNGESNAARPFAWTAMGVMLLSLLCFWVLAADALLSSRKRKNILLFSGVLSLVLLPFLPTGFHDAVINVSASLGLVAMIIVYTALYKKAWYRLFAFGLFNLLLVALNNYLYYHTSLYYLPLVQKITFASFLLWICLVTLKLYRHREGRAQLSYLFPHEV